MGFHPTPFLCPGPAAWFACLSVWSVRFAQVCQSAAFGRVMAVGPPPAPASFASLTSAAPWPIRPPKGGSLQGAGVSCFAGVGGLRASQPPRPAVAAALMAACRGFAPVAALRAASVGLACRHCLFFRHSAASQQVCGSDGFSLAFSTDLRLPKRDKYMRPNSWPASDDSSAGIRRPSANDPEPTRKDPY